MTAPLSSSKQKQTGFDRRWTNLTEESISRRHAALYRNRGSKRHFGMTSLSLCPTGVTASKIEFDISFQAPYTQTANTVESASTAESADTAESHVT